MNSAFVDIARSKMPGVVQIYVKGYVGEEVKSILNPKYGELTGWTGSGFFVDCEYGKDIIITNSHVVRNSKDIEIMSMLTSEERFKCEVVGIIKHMEPDLAVIRLQDGELERFQKLAIDEIPYLKVDSHSQINRGLAVKAIGYPMGMEEPNITGGEITNFISGDRVVAEKFVTDAAINPGNSGGPAINEQGDVIGINTSIFQDADNIGFITPSSFINIILKNIFTGEVLTFNDIGGSIQKNSIAISKMHGQEQPRGVLVINIEKDGFLEEAKVQLEDIILSINDVEIDRHGVCMNKYQFHRRNIFDFIKLFPVGPKIELTVLRNKKVVKLSACGRPFPIKKITTHPLVDDRRFIDFKGMIIQILSFEIIEAFALTDTLYSNNILKRFDENKERLIITHIESGSECHHQEWDIGEVIETVDGQPISTLDELISVINKASGIIKIKSEQGSIAYYDCKEEEIEAKTSLNYLS